MSNARGDVLVIAQDRQFAVELLEAVNSAGFSAASASNLGGAIELARTNPFGIVIADEVEQSPLIEAIGRVSPDTVYLLASRAADSQAAAPRGRDSAVAGLLALPLAPEEVATKLGSAWDLYLRRIELGSSGGKSTLSILVIEDSTSDILLIKDALERLQGVSVTWARDLARATRLLHDYHYDVVLTDLGLPDARGTDAVLRLRTAAPSSAIVVCSGNDDELLELHLLRLGAQECISKSELDLLGSGRTLRRAAERKKSQLQLMEIAYVDALTGLANRAGWREQASSALVRSARLGLPSAVFMVDLDGFKGMNDTLGHEAGDNFLKATALVLHQSARACDSIARLGGDEFAIFVTGAQGCGSFEALAERLLDGLRRITQDPSAVAPRVTASMGVAMFPGHGETLALLVGRADEALYLAKRSGKNRCVVWGGDL